MQNNEIDQLVESNQQLINRNHKHYVMGALVLLLIALVFYSLTTSQTVVMEAEPVQQLSEEQNAALREQFKQQLVDTENNIETITTDNDFVLLGSDAIAQYTELKSDALVLFGNSDYQGAIAQLNSAIEVLTEAETQWNNAFEQAFNNAQTHFNKQDFNASQISLNQAVAIKPSSQQAAELQRKLTIQPLLTEKYAQYDVAVIENDINKQIATLEQVLDLAPNAVDAQQLLADAKKTVKNREFTNLISNGLKALEQGKLEQSGNFYYQARKLYPTRPELNLLGKHLNKSASAVTVAQVHQQLTTLTQTDNWVDVHLLTIDAAKMFPTNKLILDSRDKAAKIIAFQNELAEFLQRPERLRDANIQLLAKQAIGKAQLFTTESDKLKQQINQVTAVIEQANQLVTLTLESDQQTTVSIPGIGSLGKFQSKTVQLPSGDFTLLGMRNGYAAKRTEFTVNAQSQLTLKMICDERIR